MAFVMTTDAFLLWVGAAGVVVVFLLRDWLGSRVRAVGRLMGRVEAGESSDHAAGTGCDHDLVLAEEGFEIRALKVKAAEVVRVAWDRVIEADAYKLDCWSTDRICIGFTMDDGVVIEIHEEMRGFPDVGDRLAVALPGAMDFGAWYPKIMVPAFEPCLTRLFTRDAVPRRSE